MDRVGVGYSWTQRSDCPGVSHMPPPAFHSTNLTSGRPARNPTESSPVRLGDGQWLIAEIPVYGSTPQAYNRSSERRPRRYVVRRTAQERQQLREFGDPGRGRVPRLWDYNEIAGWIQLLVVLGGTVKGYLWRKRIAKTPNKGMMLFDLEGYGAHDLECAFVGCESSADIYCRVRRELVALADQEFSEKCYLDLEAFDTIGPLVNWRMLLGFGPSSPLLSRLEKSGW